MMNLLLYVEAQETLEHLRGAAGPCGRLVLSYPDDIYEDAQGRPSALPCSIEALFEWQPAPTPQAAYAY